MLISPAKKRLEELQQRLREIRTPIATSPSPEVVAIQDEINRLNEQLSSESGSERAVLKG
jgi:hypothetical protein